MNLPSIEHSRMLNGLQYNAKCEYSAYALCMCASWNAITLIQNLSVAICAGQSESAQKAHTKKYEWRRAAALNLSASSNTFRSSKMKIYGRRSAIKRVYVQRTRNSHKNVRQTKKEKKIDASTCSGKRQFRCWICCIAFTSWHANKSISEIARSRQHICIALCLQCQTQTKSWRERKERKSKQTTSLDAVGSLCTAFVINYCQHLHPFWPSLSRYF